MSAIPISELSTATPKNSAVFPFSQINDENNLSVTYKITLEDLSRIITGNISSNLSTVSTFEQLSSAGPNYVPDANLTWNIYLKIKDKMDINGDNTLLSNNGKNDFTNAALDVSTILSNNLSPVNVGHLNSRLSGIDSTYTAFPDYDKYIEMTSIPYIKRTTIQKQIKEKHGTKWVWTDVETPNILTADINITAWDVVNYKRTESPSKEVNKTRTNTIIEYIRNESPSTSTYFNIEENGTNAWIFNLKKKCWVRFVHTSWLNENVESHLQVRVNNNEWFNLAKSLSYATNPKHGITGDSGLLPFNAGTKIRMFGRYALYFIPMK